MAIMEHETRAYESVKRALVAKEDSFFDDYVVCSSVLDKFWSSFLTYSELLVLRFIVGRTLLYRKRAESIGVSQFISGVAGRESGMVCHGVSLSENTVRRAIRALHEKGYVTIHCFKEGNVECHARVYEVNTQRIVAERNVEEITKLLNRPRKVGAEPLPIEQGHPSPHLGGLTLLGKPNRYTSTNVEVSAATAPTKESGFLRTPRKPRKPIATDCKPEATPQELLDAITTRYRDNRESRSAAAKKPSATKKWTTQTLQALLDKAREAALEQGYTVPRVVVVAKNLNVLWKRMVDSGIDDALDFFTWTLCNWSTVASANKRAAVNRVKQTSKAVTPMGMAPNFNDLAFRCPYILAFYNDRQYAEAEEERVEEQKRTRLRRATSASQEAAAQRRELIAERDRAREEQIRKEEEATVRAVRRSRSRPAAVDFADDEEIPVFKEREYR